MKKITFFSIVMLLMMFATLAIKANEPTTDVYIHYYRYDQNYDGWNLWVWQNLPTASEGLPYTFEEDDTDTIFNYGGVVSKISLSDNLEGSTRLGFIVRKNEWEEKDIDNDRFIDITETTEDGILHVYLVEGD